MEPAPSSRVDIYKQQFDGLWAWSRFYHDAEIKVNSTSAVISAFGALAQSYGKSFTIKLSFLNFNLTGAVIVIISLAALVSTIGYWRNYELCDLYAKQFREKYIDKEELELIQIDLEKNFKEKYPCLSNPLLEDAHHIIWIVVQLALLCLGIAILTNTNT